jgi:hypothetical protein
MWVFLSKEQSKITFTKEENLVVAPFSSTL